MGFVITGGAGNNALVDVNGNLAVNLPLTAEDAGFAALLSEVDAGTVTGTRLVKALEASLDFRLRTGVDAIWFSEFFPGTTLNSSIWTAPVTTMTVTVSGGFVRLNAGSSTASGANAAVRSYRTFPMFGSARTYVEIHAQFSQAPVANNVCEWGIFLPTTDGAFFRLDASGDLRCVTSFNSSESSSGPLSFNSLVGVGATKRFLIGVSDESVLFWINDVLVYQQSLPTAQPATVSMQDLPVAIRTANNAVTAAAQQILVGMVAVTTEDLIPEKPFGHKMGGMGQHATQYPTTGSTVGQTANYANSANPTAVVPTNTTAALGSGLGGQFWETDTLAVNTDGIISSFQVPAAAAATGSKSLYITGIRLDSFIQTVLTGGGYVAQWCVAYGHTAVSLATTETATTKAPRRIPLGNQAVAAAAAAGTVLTSLSLDLSQAPICVQPGEFIQLVKKKVGTAPSAGTVAHVITFIGYWE